MADEVSTLRGIRATIYRAYVSDLSEGGLSASCSEVTVCGPGIPGLYAPEVDAPPVRLVVERVLLPVRVTGPVSEDAARQLVKIASPSLTAFLVPWEAEGRMLFGGTYVAGDGRFTDLVSRALGVEFYGALPLHDRSVPFEE